LWSRRSCCRAIWSASWCSSASTPRWAWADDPHRLHRQASLGHAAFLAIGAYTAAYLQQYNVPFPVYFLAGGLLTGVVGALVGFPALRLQGIYLVIATISFAFIVEEVLARWESVTHGNEGMRVKT
jgi:branched-chain amino acid transport system permease protein